ncbi:unnamed protein product [Rangifer tarandus platyrhynchus]|uniref:Uncharacterized protein n=1 Tax=Rangifer tarandus platyrhynchus TaxID=3082113 RepID=A0AC59Y7R2_RANTA
MGKGGIPEEPGALALVLKVTARPLEASPSDQGPLLGAAQRKVIAPSYYLLPRVVPRQSESGEDPFLMLTLGTDPPLSQHRMARHPGTCAAAGRMPPQASSCVLSGPLCVFL